MNLAFAELGVQNLSRSLEWYCSVLGLVLELHDDARGFALLRDDRGAKIALKEGLPGSIRWQFEVPDLVKSLHELAAKGVVPENEMKTSEEGYRRVVLRDPDGNPVSLFDWHPCG